MLIFSSYLSVTYFGLSGYVRVTPRPVSGEPCVTGQTRPTYDSTSSAGPTDSPYQRMACVHRVSSGSMHISIG